MGKTSTVAMLAMKYVVGEEGMDKFDFVWTVRLKNVDEKSSLPEIIKQQHSNLRKFPTDKVRSILYGENNSKVALLFDGYDEYQPGKNKDIDSVLKSRVGNCFLVLTSRPDFVSNEIRKQMDVHINIEGLSAENIKKCCDKYLHVKEKRRELLKQAASVGIYHPDGFIPRLLSFGKPPDTALLRIPIILLMTCFIYEQNESLPKSKTEIIKTLYRLLGERSDVRAAQNVEHTKHENVLFKLGKLAWEAIRNDKLQLQKVILVLMDIQGVQTTILYL